MAWSSSMIEKWLRRQRRATQIYFWQMIAHFWRISLPMWCVNSLNLELIEWNSIDWSHRNCRHISPLRFESRWSRCNRISVVDYWRTRRGTHPSSMSSKSFVALVFLSLSWPSCRSRHWRSLCTCRDAIHRCDIRWFVVLHDNCSFDHCPQRCSRTIDRRRTKSSDWQIRVEDAFHTDSEIKMNSFLAWAFVRHSIARSSRSLPVVTAE